jgi:hypothetical protein
MVTRSPARRSLVHCGRIVRPVILVALLGACDSNSATAPGPSLAVANGPNGKNPVVRITPESDTADALGQTIQLTANVSTPTWASLTPGVVTVDAEGRVVSVGTGFGLVQAMVGRKADTAEVLVRQIPVSLNVTPDSLEFLGFSDEPQTLTAVLADANGFPLSGQPAVTWSSDDPSVATVADGVVTATLGAGFTWIRAIFEALTDSAFVNTPATPYP